MHNFKKLDIWINSLELSKFIYLKTAQFPKEEQFGLISQIRRSSISIVSNIAEGSSRRSNKEFSRFLEIAIGSCYEIETQLLIAIDLNFISFDKTGEIIKELNEIIKMISRFKSNLKI